MAKSTALTLDMVGIDSKHLPGSAVALQKAGTSRGGKQVNVQGIGLKGNAQVINLLGKTLPTNLSGNGTGAYDFSKTASGVFLIRIP